MSRDNDEPVREPRSDASPAHDLPPGWGAPVTDADGKELLQDPAGIERHEAVEEVGYPSTTTTPRSVFGDRAAGGPV